MLESLVIVLLAHGGEVRWSRLLAGCVSLAAVHTLVGFVVVSRFDSINRFLIPSSVVVLAIQLPILDYLGLWTTSAFRIWPTDAPLWWMGAALGDVPPDRLAAGPLVVPVWLVVLFGVARRAYRRIVLGPPGARMQ